MFKPWLLVFCYTNVMSVLRLFLYGFLMVLLKGLSFAQSPTAAYRRTTPLTFDGVIDSQEWKETSPLPLTLHAPTYKGTPSNETLLYLGYDDQYLYLAGRMIYAEPDRLLATSKKRDAFEPANDWLGIVIDSFNDNENTLCFFTTPAGLRSEANVYNDGQGEMPINISWNTFWDVKVSLNEGGYDAEIRIPFSSLRFQDSNGEVIMGISAFHYYAFNNESVVFPDIPPDWGGLSAWKASQTHKFIFHDIFPSKKLYIAPYVLGGVQTEQVLNSTGTAYESQQDPTREGGLDLKYSVSSNMTLDITVNPDFAQVEADDEQVNLTRFSLFFPEKRLFFQERSSIFDFPLGGPNRLFYSRRIGLHDDGPVRIYGGLRMVGRVGNWDMGLLDMQTESIYGTASTNYGVLRLRKQAINEYSYLGGMVTNKLDKAGNYNTATGLDGTIRVTPNDYLLFNYAQTFYNDLGASPFSMDNAKLRITAERRAQKGFGYDVTYVRTGEHFDPVMGFEVRENYWLTFNRIWWGWQPGENSKWFNYQVFAQGYHFNENTTNKLQSADLSVGVNGETKNGQGFSLEGVRQIEYLTDTFFLSDHHFILSGHYPFNLVKGQYNTPFGKKLMLIALFNAGDYYDGRQFVLALMPTWKVSSSIDFNINFIYNDVLLPERNMHYQAIVGRFRSTYMLNTRLSASAFVQINTLDHQVLSNVRIRYNPREGNDLYLVYNQGANTHRYREIPTIPLTAISTWAIKYTHTFVVGK